MFAEEPLDDDKSIVLAAVKRYGFALQFASESLANDKEVVLAAVRMRGAALNFASTELQADKEVVLAAVSKPPSSRLRLRRHCALRFASAELRADAEVVLKAVASNGRELEFAAEPLQGDLNVVLAAVANHRGALEHASDELYSGIHGHVLDAERGHHSFVGGFLTAGVRSDSLGECYSNLLDRSSSSSTLILSRNSVQPRPALRRKVSPLNRRIRKCSNGPGMEGNQAASYC